MNDREKIEVLKQLLHKCQSLLNQDVGEIAGDPDGSPWVEFRGYFLQERATLNWEISIALGELEREVTEGEAQA